MCAARRNAFARNRCIRCLLVTELALPKHRLWSLCPRSFTRAAQVADADLSPRCDIFLLTLLNEHRRIADCAGLWRRDDDPRLRAYPRFIDDQHRRVDEFYRDELRAFCHRFYTDVVARRAGAVPDKGMRMPFLEPPASVLEIAIRVHSETKRVYSTHIKWTSAAADQTLDVTYAELRLDYSRIDYVDGTYARVREMCEMAQCLLFTTTAAAAAVVD